MPVQPRPWSCPECGGTWMRNFVFQHRVNACNLGSLEDSRQYADFEQLQRTHSFTRPSTIAEITLYQAIYDEPLNGYEAITEVSGPPGYRTRIINRLNPDTTNEGAS